MRRDPFGIFLVPTTRPLLEGMSGDTSVRGIVFRTILMKICMPFLYRVCNSDMGGFQNYEPFWDPYYDTAPYF